MTNITLPRSVVQQALDALEYGGLLKRRQAITALREALEQPQQEELSCGVDYDDGLLTVSVVRGHEDGSMEVIHHEQIAMPVKALEQQPQHGCHADDEYPGGCVLDFGSHEDCFYARRYGDKAREKCGQWRPIKTPAPPRRAGSGSI